MAIIEVTGGPVTHRYLMRKSKDEMASMYMRMLRETERDARDAERYRWLRKQNWNEAELCVVARPVVAVKLGHDCPSLARLDDVIDAAMQGANG